MKIMILFTLLMASPLFAKEDTLLTTMVFDSGISIKIPAHWTVLSSDARKNLKLATNSMANDALGVSELDNKQTILAVNSTPFPTGARIRR